jgi:Family of unknown function (DUF5317)
LLWIAALAIGLIAGFAIHGRIDNLARLRFRWAWLVVAVLLIRGVILLTPIRHINGVQYLYLAALTALVAWTVWQIQLVRGIWLIAAGTALNLVVVALNGARMPVAPDLAGALVHSGTLGQYAVMTAQTNLGWLADWIALPGPIGRLVPEAYSPGDVVVAVGIAAVIALAMRSPAGSIETRPRIVSDPP